MTGVAVLDSTCGYQVELDDDDYLVNLVQRFSAVFTHSFVLDRRLVNAFP